jgi:hypothetical protein
MQSIYNNHILLAFTICSASLFGYKSAWSPALINRPFSFLLKIMFCLLGVRIRYNPLPDSLISLMQLTVITVSLRSNAIVDFD